jgi:hypothetical protein
MINRTASSRGEVETIEKKILSNLDDKNFKKLVNQIHPEMGIVDIC